MISIPKQLTLDVIDGLLGELRENPAGNLRLPRELTFRSILTTAAYNQLLLTWARQSIEREVEFYGGTSDDIAFLPKAPETVVPLLLAKKALFWGPENHAIEYQKLRQLRQEGLDQFAPIKGVPIQASLFGSDEPTFHSLPRKGQKVQLLISDADFRHDAPHWFYSGLKEARKLRDASDLASLVRSVLTLIRDVSVRRYGSWVDKLPEILGDMLYELVDNTDKWGKHTVRKEPIQLLRGVLFDVRFEYSGNKTRLMEVASGIPLLESFIGFHSNPEHMPNLGLLEMAVFDSGEGMASWELTKRDQLNPSIEQEYAATLDCLKKWGTTSGQTGRGLGLDRVLNLAAMRKGFVYLRTGRLILYRDFANNPASDSENINANTFDRHVLYDWDSQSESPSEQNPVDGTLLSVVLPFSASTP